MLARAAASVAAFAVCASVSWGQPALTLTTKRVAFGLQAPLYVIAPPGDTGRVFIVEQGSGGTARIKILKLQTGVVNAMPFLTISGILTGGERGLLGLAFHPDYANNGLFYINYTASGGGAAGHSAVWQYKVSADPDIADPGSGSIVIRYDQPFSNHNGGWIGFGPDEFLYIATGDGGSGGDPGNRAQNIENQPLGKMLRIDVDGDDFPLDPNRNYAIPPTNPFVGKTGDDEIWAYGLRNPWRNAFDRMTGDLYIADVGQNAWEEINFQPGASAGGENYGWRCYEGNAAFNLSGNPPPPCPPVETLVFPFHVYSHAFGCSITGGYAYRGCDIPHLDGTYFFADYCTNRIWSLKYDGTTVTQFIERTAELAPGGGLNIQTITSFGEDGRGEMYITDSSGGEVFQIVPRCYEDCDGNGLKNIDDFLCFQLRFATGHCYADCDGNGVMNIDDFLCYQLAFAVGC